MATGPVQINIIVNHPPRDFPEDGDWAVTRSVGAMRVWRGQTWRWADGMWHVVAELERA